tara:strand:+ start:2841 stop:3113 length:273 start_codon:yes stop_codon:yes gene_type:complete
MNDVNVGTLLGKCVVDGQPIYSGDGIRSKHATIVNGKWLSGETLLKVVPQCISAFMDDNRDKEAEKELLLGRLSDFGWQVNPETGKLTKL